jgi:gamma-glutamyl-gamma-aminobutyrate hydrolase PuuD
MFIWLSTAIFFGSCGNSVTRIDGNDGNDTLVIVASRLFESRTYQDFLEPLAHPVPIKWHDASALTKIELNKALAHAHGVVLTGGADIHPSRYDRATDTLRCGRIDLERDALESFLLDEVDRTGLPFLGICRGMQFMNVHGGGSLHPHLPDVLGHNGHRGGAPGNTLDTTHMVKALKAWSSASWEPGDSSVVISHHHQGIDRLAEGLEAWATAPDGLIEGVVRRDTMGYPCYIGVQWHPERSKKRQPLVESVGAFFVRKMTSHLQAEAHEGG